MSFKRDQIEGIAWAMTVGAGKEQEKPTPADEHEAMEHFGQSFTSEQLDCFRKAWDRCVMEMAFP